MPSTNTYTPYFYIIRHISSQKLYAGSRYAKNCHPDEFMQPNGYTTSSTIINSIIKSEGLESFEILRIDINCDGLHPHDYETAFLEINDCADLDNWFNKHNNNLYTSFGTENYKQSMLERYGYTTPQHIPEIKEKTKQTNLEKYGVEYPVLSVDVQKKIKQTNLEKYGVANPFESEEIQKRIQQTNLEKYGVDNPAKSENVKEKIKQTNLEKYGVECTLFNTTVQEQIKQTNLERYGVANPFESEEIQKRIQQTNLEKYGFKTGLLNPEIKQKSNKTNLEKYGVTNHSNFQFLSIIENRKTYPKCSISKYYPELKQFY